LFLGQLINGVIPGNPVTREYEIKEKTGTAGPSLLWVIYSAVKKSSGQPASVWVLTRLSLDKFDRQVCKNLFFSRMSGLLAL
jgi:SCY1-like protein 2